SGTALRRHAAKSADRPLPRARAVGAVDGRAVRGARRDDAAGAAGRDPAHHPGKPHHGRVRHARSRRGDLSRRSCGRALSQPGPHRTGVRGRSAEAAQSAHHPRKPGVSAPAARAVRLHPRGRSVKLLKALVLPVLLLIVWEVTMRVSGVESDSLAMPSQIAVAFYEALRDGTILRRTAETLRAALTGLAIGGGSALIVSIVLGLIPAAARLAQFSVEVLRPVPAVALIPVAILTLGFGYAMEVSLVAFA